MKGRVHCLQDKLAKDEGKHHSSIFAFLNLF